MERIRIQYDELYEYYIIRQMRTKEIAMIYNTTPNTIIRKLHKYNIPVRTSEQTNRKYYFNEDYFNEINTKEKAYVLGLICADGWVAKNKYNNANLLAISLQQKDLDVIVFVKEQLETNKKIIIKNNSASIDFCSCKMARVLVDYGVVPNKSLQLSLKEVIRVANIKNEFIPSFLLGYFDGDGGIYESQGQWSCGFTGTLETCIFLKEWFSCGFIVDEKSKSGNTYTFKISGRNQVFANLSKLYDIHNSFSMGRKKEKFLVLKSLLNQK